MLCSQNKHMINNEFIETKNISNFNWHNGIAEFAGKYILYMYMQIADAHASTTTCRRERERESERKIVFGAGKIILFGEFSCGILMKREKFHWEIYSRNISLH